MTQTTEEKFMQIFSGLDRAYGVYEITGQKNTAKGIKKDGRGKTLQEPLTLDLWKQINKIQNSSLNFLICDIRYFNIFELKEIRNNLSNVSIINNLNVI